MPDWNLTSRKNNNISIMVSGGLATTGGSSSPGMVLNKRSRNKLWRNTELQWGHCRCPSSSHTSSLRPAWRCYRPFCLETVILLRWRIHCLELFVVNTGTSCQKYSALFPSYGKLLLVQAMMTTSRPAISLHVIICDIRSVCCLSNIWNKLEVKKTKD